MRRGCLLLAALLCSAPAAAETTADPIPPAELPASVPTPDVVSGGLHLRLVTAHGAVHVWTPPGYDAATAGTVVYVHGHGVNADEAWRRHFLADQFAASRRNAVFIVCEAAEDVDEPVRWRSLADLLRVVREQSGLGRPGGPLVAVGHSGAYTTLAWWLDYAPLEEIVCLDAFFGYLEEFNTWMVSARGHASHRLILVGRRTWGNARRFALGFERSVVRHRVPASGEQFSAREREARVLALRSQWGHHKIIERGEVLPVVLQATRIPSLP